ncbi:tetratricopeptide repeat protein [bacterium]|nr:tetratricopeptide repeat protein [bacterium]MBP9810661.1 tetratricopeptide repeat protein [bacterium]
MKQDTRTSAQVFRKLLPFLFLLCLGTLLFFGSKITGGSCGPAGRDDTQLIFGTILNLILLTFNAALFCVFEACQLITDLRVHPTQATEVLLMHFLKAGLPLLCVILGKWCWKISRQDDSATQEMTAQPAHIKHLTIANFLAGQSQTKRFLRELVLFSIVLLALSPFHSRLIAAPSNLVENIRLYTFSQKLIKDPHSYHAFWDELRLAQTYANLGKYKQSFDVINSLIAETSKPANRERLDDIYSRFRDIAPSNSVSAAEWLRLTSYADNNLEAMFRSAKPAIAADGTWNRDRNENTNGSLKYSANGLIRACQKHGCTEQAIKWIKAKGTLQRKLLGGDSENLQNISTNLYRDLAQTDEKQNYAPLLQKNIALLECTQPSNSTDSWSEHWRKERLQFSIEILEELSGVATTSNKEPESSFQLDNYDEVKARMQKELALTKQSGNYARARDKARDIARLIHRHHDTVSKEAASYYNQMIALENRAPVARETQLSHLLEASKSNFECGNIKEGEEYLAKIQILRKSLFGENYDGQARDLNSQGLACLKNGKPAEARALYEKALKLDTDLGARNKAIAIYLNNLGRLSEQLKDFDQAEKYYRQALLIDKNAPCEMLDVASDYENLGKLCLQRGQKATALKNLVAARDTKSQILGADAVEAVDLDRAIAKAKTLEETAQLFKKNSNTL